MLSKMPPQEKPKTETPALNYKLIGVIVLLFAMLGLAGGYTIFPLLQSPKIVILTPNLTNNTTSNSAGTIKHSTKYTNSSAQKSVQNSSLSTTNKNTVKTTSSAQENSIKKSSSQKNSS